MENKGSPETLRETTFFQFEEFYQQNNFPRQSKHFYEWFLGFAEGDGSFLISITKDTRQPTAKAKPRAFFFLLLCKKIPVFCIPLKRNLVLVTCKNIMRLLDEA
jgi:hypothetical protein